MARLSFATEISTNRTDGEEGITGLYVVPANPFEYEKPRMELISRVRTLDGPGGYQHAPYNHKIHTFSWKKLPAISEYYDMVQQLKEYNGTVVFLKEGSAGTDRNEIWKQVLIINVKAVYDDAPNVRYYYKSVKLQYVLVPHGYREGDLYSTSVGDWEPPETIPISKRLTQALPDPID